MSLAVKNPHALNTVGVIGTYFLHPHPFLAVLAGFFAAGFFAFVSFALSLLSTGTSVFPWWISLNTWEKNITQ